MESERSDLTDVRVEATRVVMEGTEGEGLISDARSVSAREAAFQQLAEGLLEESYQLANVILGRPSESRDAVHDAYIKAWQKWPSLRDQGRFEWWFKRIVVNTCRNRLRDGNKRRGPDIDTQIGPIAPDPAGSADDRIVVEQALASLKPDDRIVLALRYYKDLKLADIAELLAIPTGTVKSRLNKAHDRLPRLFGGTYRTFFSATKFAAAAAIVAVFGAFLLLGVLLPPSDDQEPAASASPDASVSPKPSPADLMAPAPVTGAIVTDQSSDGGDGQRRWADGVTQYAGGWRSLKWDASDS